MWPFESSQQFHLHTSGFSLPFFNFPFETIMVQSECLEPLQALCVGGGGGVLMTTQLHRDS